MLGESPRSTSDTIEALWSVEMEDLGISTVPNSQHNLNSAFSTTSIPTASRSRYNNCWYGLMSSRGK